MPLTGPTWINTEKNKLEQSEWIMLIDLVYSTSPEQHLRICKWSEDITWNGFVWTAWPIGDISPTTALSGELPTTDIVIGGISSFIMKALETNVVEGKKGTIYIVHIDHLVDNTPVRKMPFTVIQISATWETVVFSVVLAQAAFEPLQLGLPTVLTSREQFPGIPGHIILSG